MSHPHVVRMIYRLVFEPGFEVRTPPPVDWSTPVFHARLEGELLTVDLLEHHATFFAARARVDPYLLAWQIVAALRRGAWMSFHYDGCEIIDRDPPQPGTEKTGLVNVEMRLATHAKAYLVSPAYPDPPTQFAASPVVATLWLHYAAHRSGRERLTDMAYFCLTQLIASAGDDEAAAQRYGVSLKVLKKLGHLSSSVGTQATIRKVTPDTEFREHTPQEKHWMMETIKAVILRAGAYEADSSTTFPQITLADLPHLP